MADPNPYSHLTDEEIADSPKANPLGLTASQLRALGADCKREVDESHDAKGTLPDRWDRNTGLYNLDPTLTTDPNKFLRPQTGLSGNTLVNASGGYTVTYTPADGSVDAGGFC